MYNELEIKLDDVFGKKVIKLSKPFYKSIKKTKKELESAYNVKIKLIK